MKRKKKKSKPKIKAKIPAIFGQSPKIGPKPYGPVDVADYPSPEAARWGQSPSIQLAINTSQIAAIVATGASIISLTHPEHNRTIESWVKWRAVYEGGDRFVEEYLKKFSRRESPREFRQRKEITPIPSFAKGAINEIKNAIFQRMTDTVRINGPDTYQQSIKGLNGGVDLKGATINWFIGHHIIAELLTMRKIGVFVDMPDPGITVRDKGKKHPYFYTYRAEDIINWNYSQQGSITEFDNILLKECIYTVDQNTGLPSGEQDRFRHVWIGEDGYVHVQFYDHSGLAIDQEIILSITRIPFVVFEITESLLKDVSNAQIALLNLDSSDVSYTLKANYPFYTEQFDDRNNSHLVKQAQEAYTEFVGNQAIDPTTTKTQDIEVGVTQGRRYAKGLERPNFINPSPEPLMISMAKQKALKEDIRAQVHLALSNITPTQASAESKVMDQAGLESGLSYIGLELEHGERQLASYWTMYEGTDQEPTINYPKTWSLKSYAEVKSEVEQLQQVRDDIPSLTFKKEINKHIAQLLLSSRVPLDLLTVITKEIDSARGSTSDPKTISLDLDAGIVGQQTASTLRGYAEDEVAKAKVDQAARLALIQEAQMGRAEKAVAIKTDEAAIQGQDQNPAARGIKDQSPNPTLAAKIEKINKPQRGQGK